MGDNERIMWPSYKRPVVWEPSRDLGDEPNPMSGNAESVFLFIPDLPDPGGLNLGLPQRIVFGVHDKSAKSPGVPTLAGREAEGSNCVAVVNPWSGRECKPGGAGHWFEYAGYDLEVMETMRDDLRRLMALPAEQSRFVLDELWSQWLNEARVGANDTIDRWFEGEGLHNLAPADYPFTSRSHWVEHCTAARYILMMDPESAFRQHCEQRLPAWPGTAQQLFSTVAVEGGYEDHPDLEPLIGGTD